MNDHVSEDRLIDLAAGLVPGGESESLLAHLRGCASCESRFVGVCRDLERTKLRTAPSRSRLVAIAAVAVLAAAILVAVVLIPILRSSRYVDPSAYWLPVEEETVDLRAAPPGVDEAVFAEAAEAYRRHDPARVVALLTGKTIPSSHDPLKLLQASALLKTADPISALAVLESLHVESLPQPYRDRAQWIRLGALRAAGRDAEAEALAADIASGSGEFARAARSQSGRPRRKNPAQ